MYTKAQMEHIFRDEEETIGSITFESMYPGNIRSNIEIYNVMKNKYDGFDGIDKKTFMGLCKLYREKHTLEDAYCVVCGRLCNVRTDYSFRDSCSKECGRVIAARKTSERYSKKSAQEIQEIKNKRSMTNLRRFGSTTNLQSEEMIKKRIEKYGGNSIFCSKEIQEKIKRNNLEKYGVENVFASNEVKEKIKHGNLVKYGKENPAQVDLIKDKIKETNIERYGGVCMGSKELYKKALETKQNKYGTFWPQRLDVTKEKTKQTNLERTGYGAPMQNPETKQKSTETCMKKYGVMYNCLRPECKEASGHIISKINLNWKSRLEALGLNVELEKIVSGRCAFDLYIPESNTLIDVNPTITHQSTREIITHFGTVPFKANNDHVDKLCLAESNGYRCMMVWDWDNEEKILQSLKPRKAIYARKCDLKEILLTDLYDEFLDTYHFQGACKGTITALGLFYEDELISVMTFGRPRYNRNVDWELLRLCTKPGYLIIGGAQRMFNRFLELQNPQLIVSYCDRSKFSGEVYSKLGFTCKSTVLKPSKHWYNPVTQRHITNSLLLQRGFSQLHGDNNYQYANRGDSNEQLMIAAGYLEVYDCGQATYIWNNSLHKNSAV